MAAMNLFALLDQAATRFPRHGAVYSGVERSTTMRTPRRALRLAASLRRRHRAGDRIAIVTENRPQYVELLFGIWAAGLVAVPVNAKLQRAEPRRSLPMRCLRLFVSPALADGLASELPNTLASACALVAFDGDAYVEALTEAAAAPAERAGRARVAVLHQRHDRPAQGRDAHPPQPARDDARATSPTSTRSTPATRSSTPRRCRTARGSTSLPHVARAAHATSCRRRGGFDPAEMLDLRAPSRRADDCSPRRRWSSAWSTHAAAHGAPRARPQDHRLRRRADVRGRHRRALRRARARASSQIYGQGEVADDDHRAVARAHRRRMRIRADASGSARSACAQTGVEVRVADARRRGRCRRARSARSGARRTRDGRLLAQPRGDRRGAARRLAATPATSAALDERRLSDAEATARRT